MQSALGLSVCNSCQTTKIVRETTDAARDGRRRRRNGALRALSSRTARTATRTGRPNANALRRMRGQSVALEFYRSRKAMADIGQRVAELYQQLSFPSASKLQSALRKEGITLSLSALEELTSESGARQVLQPPPRYGGHITSSRIDDRWAADLLSFESRPAK